MMERHLSGLLQCGEYHTDDPEENDIIAGNQYVGRIEILELRCLVRPSKRGERPQCRAEPCIERIFILCKMRTATLRTDLRHLPRHNGLAAVIAVVSRNPMPPPELS